MPPMSAKDIDRITVPFEVKIGRPSKYHEGICDEIIVLGAAGYTKAEMAAHFHVTRNTLDDWAKAHPNFSEAYQLANNYSQVFWERYAKHNMENPNFNHGHWRNCMQARFRDDYTERRINEVVGDGGGPVLIAEHKRIDVRLLSPDEQDQLEQLLIAADNPEAR